MGRETLRRGGKILTDIEENMSHDVSRMDIVSKHLIESVQNVKGNLCGGGLMRAIGFTSVTKKR